MQGCPTFGRTTFSSAEIEQLSKTAPSTTLAAGSWKSVINGVLMSLLSQVCNLLMRSIRDHIAQLPADQLSSPSSHSGKVLTLYRILQFIGASGSSNWMAAYYSEGTFHLQLANTTFSCRRTKPSKPLEQQVRNPSVPCERRMSSNTNSISEMWFMWL